MQQQPAAASQGAECACMAADELMKACAMQATLLRARARGMHACMHMAALAGMHGYRAVLHMGAEDSECVRLLANRRSTLGFLAYYSNTSIV